MIRFLRLRSAWLCLLLAAGCAGYRLGPTNNQVAGAQSIKIQPFANATLQPRMGDEVTTALRRVLQQDATFRLASRGEADLQVTGTVVRYSRRELSFVPGDVLTVSDFQVSIRARVVARDVRADKVVLDREVAGYTLVRVGADLVEAERQARPLLAQDLARNIAALLTEGTW